MMLDVPFDRDGGRTMFSATCRVDDKAVCTRVFSRNQTTFGAALQQAIVDLRWSLWPGRRHSAWSLDAFNGARSSMAVSQCSSLNVAGRIAIARRLRSGPSQIWRGVLHERSRFFPKVFSRSCRELQGQYGKNG